MDQSADQLKEKIKKISYMYIIKVFFSAIMNNKLVSLGRERLYVEITT